MFIPNQQTLTETLQRSHSLLLNLGYLQILGHANNQQGNRDIQSQPYKWLFTETGSELDVLLVLSTLTPFYISLLLSCPTAAHSLRYNHSVKDHKSVHNGNTHPSTLLAGFCANQMHFPSLKSPGLIRLLCCIVLYIYLLQYISYSGHMQ